MYWPEDAVAPWEPTRPLRVAGQCAELCQKNEFLFTKRRIVGIHSTLGRYVCRAEEISQALVCKSSVVW